MLGRLEARSHTCAIFIHLQHMSSADLHQHKPEKAAWRQTQTCETEPCVACGWATKMLHGGDTTRWTPEAVAQERRLSSVTAPRQPPGSSVHREYLSLLELKSLEILGRRASWLFSYRHFTLLSRRTKGLSARREEQLIRWSRCMSFIPVSCDKTCLCIC